jgi:RNA-directed DNA polymerase
MLALHSPPCICYMYAYYDMRGKQNSALSTLLKKNNMKIDLTEKPEIIRETFYSLVTPEDVARLLEISYEQLIFFLYRTPQKRKYTSFTIKKKNGGERNILSPSKNIKILQQKLNIVLSTVYKSKPSAHGFLKDKSILTNARNHLRRKLVLNVDIEDFFPSINFGRVRGMFMAKPYNMPEKVATILAQICCHNNQLPQGAPTSPIVSNMICGQLDSHLQKLAQSYKCIYTRYADDITFSTSFKKFPISIARENDLGQIEPGEELNKIIINNGFKINQSKVWLRGQDRRQIVTGLKVNSFPNVQKKLLNQIRAMLHAWEKYGLEKTQKEFELKYNLKHRYPEKNIPQVKYIIKGKIEFVGMIRGKESSIYINLMDKLRRLDPSLAPTIESPLDVLLRRYNTLITMHDHQKRGILLQDLLNDTFKHFQIPTKKSFMRNNKAEQIDGAFEINNNHHYIVECRWREKISDVRETDGLYGQICRSEVLGLFFSINGWSENVVPTIKQNPEKRMILMNGEDFQNVLEGEIDLGALICKKYEKLRLYSEPFCSAKDVIKDYIEI